jgi:pSer/pThr/pTyr-binding forkhead associated (FHA) protein
MAVPHSSHPGFDPSATYMMTRVAQPESRLRFVGVLQPLKGLGACGPVQVDNEELVIGRQAGLGLTLADEWVSRRHARICRVDDEFVLQDLDSSNGSYVDGVPIVSCVLRPGDWIQIGRNLFRFELRLAGGTTLEELATWLG